MAHTHTHEPVAESETSPQAEYVWQQIANLARQTVAANKRAEKEHRATEKERLRADAEAQRAEAEAQRAEAEAQRAEALAEENKRLRALLDKR
jgi:hypothetical protein